MVERQLTRLDNRVGSRRDVDWLGPDGEHVWRVSRDDGNAFPVFSASRGNTDLSPPPELQRMTHSAVSLFMADEFADPVGFFVHNITTALMFASFDAQAWEGLEMAVESDADEEPLVWGEDRVPFWWLRMRWTEHGAATGGTEPGQVITTYQDDGAWGLDFGASYDPDLPESVSGSLRPRRDPPVVTGPIRAVEVVVDPHVEGASCSGVLTEVLLHGETDTTLLIAAEPTETATQDGVRVRWIRHDESVTLLPDLASADRLAWVPPRTAWVSTVRATD